MGDAFLSDFFEDKWQIPGSQRVKKTPLFSSTTIALLINSLAAILSLMRPIGDALEALYRSFRGWGR